MTPPFPYGVVILRTQNTEDEALIRSRRKEDRRTLSAVSGIVLTTGKLSLPFHLPATTFTSSYLTSAASPPPVIQVGCTSSDSINH